MGFEVIEEGNREPCEDSMVGIGLKNLVAWLAEPSCGYFRGVVEMAGPLRAVVKPKKEESWDVVWLRLLRKAGERGFSGMLEEIVEDLWPDLARFGRRRAGDIVSAVSELEKAGAVSAAELSRFLGGLKISQAPGSAAVQVMTVHKAKGLGFDVVFLPLLSNKVIPDFSKLQRFDGPDWVAEPPIKWVRRISPEFTEMERAWVEDYCYENFCVLYVAMTRAKRGLYLYLTELEARKEANSSLEGWVRTSCGDGAGVIFESGSEDFVGAYEEKSAPPVQSAPTLKAPTPLRKKRLPSAKKESFLATKTLTSGNTGGARYGSEVHQALEEIDWLRAETPIPGILREILAEGPVRDLFTEKPGIEVLREQPFEIILENQWVSGVIDRLEVRRDESGEVREAWVYDYKTDSVKTSEELSEKHQNQMESYRRAVALVFPKAEVHVALVSTRLGEVIQIDFDI